MKYYHNKLIRDKIPEIIKARGGNYKIKTISQKELKSLLRKKLVEESDEVVNAKKDELLAELADVVQIVKSISEIEGFSLLDVQKKMKEKAKTNGEFNKRIFLFWSDKPKGFNTTVKK